MTNTDATVKTAAPAKIVDQLDWHTKDTPKGELCNVCGCFSARKGATHRGLRADERHRAEDGQPAFYAVRKTVCFGTDYHVTYVWG